MPIPSVVWRKSSYTAVAGIGFCLEATDETCPPAHPWKSGRWGAGGSKSTNKRGELSLT